MSAPAAPANVYTDRAGVEMIMGACGVNLRINDSETTVISTAEELYLTQATWIASQEIDMYLLNKFNTETLTGSWLIYNWASVMAAYRVTLRRCGSPPASLQWEYEQVMDKLAQVANGQLQIAGLASLATPGIAMSNMRIDPRFGIKQMRVEGQISGQQPNNNRPVIKDIRNEYFEEPNG
jgi:hypothetical protein